MEFILIVIILLFIMTYRNSSGEGIYKFVKEQATIAYDQYAPYSYKVMREKIKELGLKDVTLLYKRAEDASKEYKETFDIVTARAVARLNILTEIVSQMVKVNGLFISMKGSKAIEELNEAKNALSICKMELVKQNSVEPSINLFFKKTSSIPSNYPRNYGQIKKKPL